MSTEAAWWMDLPDLTDSITCDGWLPQEGRGCEETAASRIEFICDQFHTGRINLCADHVKTVRRHEAHCGDGDGTCPSKAYIASVHAL